MAKFYGKIGYGITVDRGDGNWEVDIQEREFYGEFVRNIKIKQIPEPNINDDITITNEISILADSFAMENFNFIRYIEFYGVKWKVVSVELVFPRLILTTGAQYNE